MMINDEHDIWLDHDGDGDGDAVEGDDGEPDNWPPEEARQRIVIAFFPESINVFIIFTRNHKRLNKKPSQQQ